MLATRPALVAALAAVALFSGCKDKKKVEFTQAIKLHSGEVLEPQLLNQGREAFMQYCYACHSDLGDGFGPAAPYMRPPPRNFVRGTFKFPGNQFGALPVDSALDRTIRRGLHGTPMLPWDIPVVERKAIIAYIKTLSPRWLEEEIPPELEIAPDPWKGKEAEAIALGKQIYHIPVGGAGCAGCHASYATNEEITAMWKKVDPTNTDISFPLHRTEKKESEYPVMTRLDGQLRGCEVRMVDAPHDLENLSLQLNGQVIDRDTEKKEGWDYAEPQKHAEAEGGKKVLKTGDHYPWHKIVFYGKPCEAIQADPHGASVLAVRSHRLLPPDFLFHKVKSVYPVGTKVNDNNLKYTGEESSYVVYTAEMQREDLYRTIGVGIGGAAMPGWKGVFQDDEHGTGEEKLWGLVYYVQSLIELRNTKEGWELRQKLLAQAAPETPAAPEPEGGAQGGQR